MGSAQSTTGSGLPNGAINRSCNFFLNSHAWIWVAKSTNMKPRFTHWDCSAPGLSCGSDIIMSVTWTKKVKNFERKFWADFLLLKAERESPVIEKCKNQFKAILLKIKKTLRLIVKQWWEPQSSHTKGETWPRAELGTKQTVVLSTYFGVSTLTD